MAPGRVHLALFGRVAWVVNEREFPLPAGRPLGIVTILARRRPGWVSADTLLDRLWERPPSSGANALQRHITRLRRHLADVVGCDPSDVIESSAAGYRLAPHVGSDFDVVDHDAGADPDRDVDQDADPSEPDGVLGPNARGRPAWWRRPLVDADGALLGPERTALESIARRERSRWVAGQVERGSGRRAIEQLALDRQQAPGDLIEIAELALMVGESTRDRELRRAAASVVLTDADDHSAKVVARARALHEAADRTRFDYRRLADCGEAALRGDVDAAFDSLASVSEIPADLERRVVRWLVWHPTTDGFVRVMWRFMTSLPPAMSEVMEQAAVSLDAAAVERMPDPRAVADQEVDRATTEIGLVRSLRVRFMVGLGYPLHRGQLDVIERLSSVDHPDAQVEAARYTMLLAVKRGDADDVDRLIGEYQAVADRHWPGSLDDWSSLARTSISETWPEGGVTRGPAMFPMTPNQQTEDILRTVAILLRDVDATEDELDVLRDEFVSCTYTEAARAVDVLIALRRGELGRARRLGDDLAETVMSTAPHRQRSVAMVALASLADATSDRQLAGAVTALLLPFSGEMLAIWPLDAILGSADEWLRRIAPLT